MNFKWIISSSFLLSFLATSSFAQDAVKDPKPAATHEPLAGTQPLTMEGDIASQLVEGVDRFLLKKILVLERGVPLLWSRTASQQFCDATAFGEH